MGNSLSTLISNFRLQDFFDIIIIALMLYGLLIWFKRTSSRFVLAGITLLGMIYLISRFFQLYMTAVILQGFFAVLVFALIVIFQEELRRFFERLAIWGRVRRRVPLSTHEHEIEILTQTAADLAKMKTGALIVIQGEEPLGRHIEGGTRLDGVLSQALLKSIFDPHSPGHDGAVIIDRGKLVQFGTHLPLSSSLRSHGLRHTAALGLSERSDALCIVVSEERGAISVAFGKDLKELESAMELKGVLDDFYHSLGPKQHPRAAFGWIRENFPEKGIALVLACLLWFAFGYQRETVQRDFIAPIEFRNLAPEWVIEEPKTVEVKVMLAGPEQAFNLFDSSSLRVSLDLAHIKQGGQEVILSKELVRTPSNISVLSIKPDRIHIIAYRLLPVSLPVEVRTTGTTPPGISLQKIEAMPATLKVLVPPKLVNSNGLRLRTKPIDLKNVSSSVTLNSDIILPPNARFLTDRPPQVLVNIKIKQKAN